MRKSGFTLIELMVAMVIGLTAITSVYTLGAAMSKQFYEEQRLATSHGTGAGVAGPRTEPATRLS